MNGPHGALRPRQPVVPAACFASHEAAAPSPLLYPVATERHYADVHHAWGAWSTSRLHPAPWRYRRLVNTVNKQAHRVVLGGSQSTSCHNSGTDLTHGVGKAAVLLTTSFKVPCAVLADHPSRAIQQ